MQERMVAQYKILACLGGGAMGTVYKAEDTLLHRSVALKFLPADLTEDEEASRRFMREARATSTLDHPNICTIHEIAQADDGSWYIAMAWYQGKTLKRILRDGPLPPEQALNFAYQIALGLGQAHDHDVVHRDIKPANLIVTDEGNLKILDFGLARLLGQARLTRTGTVMGTAAYMSPEQARGEDVGTSSDIWSLGIVLYEMLTGRIPYEGESDVAMIYSVLNTDPAPLPEPTCRESEVCNDIINHCLVRDPRNRYPSAHVLAEDIEKVTDGSKASYSSKPSRSSIFAPPDGSRWPRVGAAVLALLLLVALAIPQSREFLGSITGLGGYHKIGVAVTPFVFAGDSPDDEAFGRGLSALVNDRLAHLEKYSDRFWVVPLEEVLRREVTDPDIALTTQGADRAVTGQGVITGRTISLNLTVYDLENHTRTSLEFRDLDGNLKTWQDDLVDWVIGQIDPGLELPVGVTPGPRGTNIPSAFLEYHRGVGYLELASEGRPAHLPEAAIPHLENAVARDSSFTCAWAQLGRAMWLRDRTTDPERLATAQEYLLTAVRIDSTAVWPHVHLGDIKSWQGDDEAAMEHYRRALIFEPYHVTAINKLAALNMRLGRNDEAESLYHRSVEVRPRYARARRDLGLLHYYGGDNLGARKCWLAWADLAPDDFAVYSLLGVSFFGEGDYRNAEAMFLESLDRQASYAVHENLATLYYYDQRYIDSIAMCRKAMEFRSDEYSTWRTLARAFSFTPGYEDSVGPAFEKAMEYLQPYLEKYPRDPEFKADHASFCAILGPREKAVALLEELEADVSGLDSSILFSMASTWEEMGERERALDWLEAAVEKDLSIRKMDHYPVLKNLRTHPRYIALRQKYEEE